MRDGRTGGCALGTCPNAQASPKSAGCWAQTANNAHRARRGTMLAPTRHPGGEVASDTGFCEVETPRETRTSKAGTPPPPQLCGPQKIRQKTPSPLPPGAGRPREGPGTHLVELLHGQRGGLVAANKVVKLLQDARDLLGPVAAAVGRASLLDCNTRTHASMYVWG